MKSEMKHKVGKEPGGGNKKRKEVGNEYSGYNSGCNSAQTQCKPEQINNFKTASQLSNRLH